jgi:predicted RNA-binding protein (virulence factor B family)
MPLPVWNKVGPRTTRARQMGPSAARHRSFTNHPGETGDPMKITLTNESHGTFVDLKVNKDGTISAQQLEEAEKTLCPLAGCNLCEDLLTDTEERIFSGYRLQRLPSGGARVSAVETESSR